MNPSGPDRPRKDRRRQGRGLAHEEIIKERKKLEMRGIEPRASRMQSERSTI